METKSIKTRATRRVLFMNTQEIQGRWDQIRGKVKEKWGQLTDDDLRIVGGNVDQVIGKIQQKTGEARGKVEEFLDRLASSSSKGAETAGGYAQAAVETAREGTRQVSEQARRGYERAGEFVQHRPAQSMAMVFGLGFVTGLTIGVLMCSSD
jgi:uncharacterized protein YjbJ (UPF0337 family)